MRSKILDSAHTGASLPQQEAVCLEWCAGSHGRSIWSSGERTDQEAAQWKQLSRLSFKASCLVPRAQMKITLTQKLLLEDCSREKSINQKSGLLTGLFVVEQVGGSKDQRGSEWRGRAGRVRLVLILCVFVSAGVEVCMWVPTVYDRCPSFTTLYLHFS